MVGGNEETASELLVLHSQNVGLFGYNNINPMTRINSDNY